MKSYSSFRNAIISSAFGAALIVGTAVGVSAQNVDSQYRQWQRAQIEAQQRQQEYLRTRNMRDYRQWQRAQARAQREYNDYIRVTNARNNGYNNGYTWNNGYNTGMAGTVRVYNNGSYYETSSRGVALLRQAVQTGYNQGYRQGQQARRYGRGYNGYMNDRYYQNGTYGWRSEVDRNQYQYYYQQGFQKGYEDGYNSTYRYGTRSGNGFNILGSVLNTILNISNR